MKAQNWIVKIDTIGKLNRVTYIINQSRRGAKTTREGMIINGRYNNQYNRQGRKVIR